MIKSTLLLLLVISGSFIYAQNITCSAVQTMLTSIENGTIDSHRKENLKQNYYQSSFTMGAKKNFVVFNENAKSGRYIFSQLSESPADFEAIAKEFKECMGNIRTKSLLMDLIDTVNRIEYMPAVGKSMIKSIALILSAKGNTTLYIYFNTSSAVLPNTQEKSIGRLY